jgi:hypothetical protein
MYTVFRRIAGVVAVLILMLSASHSARAQAVGSIRGQVTDPSAALVPNASIQLTGNGTTRNATADASGRYTFSVPPGKYSVRIQAVGFVSSQQDVTVTGGQPTPLDIALELAAQTQQVDVTAQAAGAVSTDPSTNASALVMNQDDIDALPDDPDDLQATLSAMAGPAAGPGGAQFFVDGFSGGQLPPRSSIREIRINSNPFASEFDRPGYGRVEILTRPGTDTLHGQVAATYGNRVFDTRNPFLTGRLPDYNSRMVSAEMSGSFLKKFSWNLDTDPERVFNNSSLVNALGLDSNFRPVAINQSYSTPTSNWGVEPRLDYAINSNNTLIFRYQHSTSSTIGGIGGFNLPTQETNGTTKNNTLQITETSVIGTKAVDETRFQFQDARTNTSGAGLAGPTLNVQSSFTTGGSPLQSNYNRNRGYEIQNLLTMTTGKHTMKVGGRVRIVELSTQSTSNYNGTYTFTTPQSTSAGPAVCNGIFNPTSLDVYAQTQQLLAQGMSLGAIQGLGCGPTAFSLNSGQPVAGVNQTDLGAFAQDDWRARPNLTISAGLRYETQTNIGDHRDLAPRIAISWAPKAKAGKPSKTVFRLGWGRFYDRFSANNTLQTLRFNGIAQQDYTISSTSGGATALQALAYYPNLPPVSVLSLQNQPVYKVDSNLKAPYLMQSAASIERALPHRTSLSVSITDSRGVHDARTRNINAYLPGTYNAVAHTGILPFPGLGDIYLYENTGIYKQFQVITNVTTKLNSHVSLNGYYAWGQYHTNTNGFPMNQYDTSIDWGRASGDVRHRVFIGGSVGLPLRLVASPIITVSSAPPFNITSGVDNNGDHINNDRPSFATSADSPSSVVVTPWGTFNRSPLPGEKIIPINYGTGFANVTANIRLSRSWGWGEKVAGGGNQGGGGGGGGAPGGGFGGGRGGGGGGGFGTVGSSGKKYTLTLTMSANNMLNHVNRSQPVGNLNSPFFGESLNSAGGGPGGGGGGGGGGNNQGGSAAGNRRVQFQVRFQF